MIQLIESIAEKFLQELELNGYIKPGHNGPYNDEETPVRNTAHWLSIFSYLYSETQEKKYYNAIIKCAKYLTSNNARPANATFYCRKNRNKDFSNGLIGQAWVIEALVETFKILGEKKYLALALEVFLLHPFDESKGLWKIVNVDGSIRNFDMTFNHQLYFSASASSIYNLTKNQRIKEMIDIFFGKLKYNLDIHRDGLIKHSIIFRGTINDRIKKLGKKLKLVLFNVVKGKNMIYKEIGYHMFNVYAFAILYDNGTGMEFYNGEKFNKILKFTFSKKLLNSLKENNHTSDISNIPIISKNIKVNRYGFAYNAPGFEIPYIYITFKNKIDNYNETNIEQIINEQIRLTYDYNKKMFSNNTEDGRTLTSRIHELIRYLKLKNKCNVFKNTI